MRKISAIGCLFLLALGIVSWHSSQREHIVRAAKSLPESGKMRDPRDGKWYKTVRIGTQTWMAENLSFGKTVSNMAQDNNKKIEKSFYQNDPQNEAQCGALYTWGEAMQYSKKEKAQGVCPEGWHLPSDAEWNSMLRHLDPSVKSNFTGWSGQQIFVKLSDPKGFQLSLGGNSVSGWYFYKDQMAYYWSSTSFSDASAYYRSVDKRSVGQFRGAGDIQLGMCVRCLKNEP